MYFVVFSFIQGLPEHVKDLINRMKNNKATSPFPIHLKNFARNLHFHSPAAYEMVRRSFLKCLPCVETLNTWNCSKDYKPGICREIIDFVAKMVNDHSNKGKQLIFNITFDEMNIKKWTYFCKNARQWRGFVDLAGQLEEANKDGKRQQASKALVFMLVNINGSFKTPVAYYLSNSLSGQEKCILLKDLLTELSKSSIKVVSVTFDGDESNARACKVLGAVFDFSDKTSFKPFFTHPITGENIYVFFDPCHMLKLVRNYFALKGPIIYKEHDYIRWDYIKKLNDLQYSQGLHCACKIKNRHVEFTNEKMKVFLAAQVLSSSTAKALEFLEMKIKDVDFLGASATAQFCTNFNDIFDALNSKNMFCKTPGRKAITIENLSELNTHVTRWIEYIQNLEVLIHKRKIKNVQGNVEKEVCEKNTKPIKQSVITCTVVRTGFLGFIICLKNLVSLCDDMFEKKYISYLLSYKLSQDHVEMFFALIRQMNGFTNNPVGLQEIVAE